MWVTLEQTTVLPRRASTITSSTYRGPIHRGSSSTNQDSETSTLSSAPKQTSINNSQLPRARFAEDLVIGPTSEANSRVFRRKSALKSRSPNGIPLRPSVIPSDNALAPHQSQTRRSSFTSAKLLPASSPPTRSRPPIRTAETPRSGHHLRVEDATHPAGTEKTVEGFEPFKLRQRTRSMSDFSVPFPLSNKELNLSAHEINPMDTISHSIQSPLIGYFMQQDALFRDKARRNMGLTSSTGVVDTHDDFTSTKNESLDCSDHSRLTSSTSSMTSSFSSTLLDDYTPPTPYVKSNIPCLDERQELVPPHSMRLDDEPERGSLFLSVSPPLRQEEFPDKWVSNSSSGPMVSPLERLSSNSCIRPGMSTRRRSGTVLPPKKPEIIFHELTSAATASFSAEPSFSNLAVKPPKPPVRPPRSNLRENPGKHHHDHSGKTINDNLPLEVPTKSSEFISRLKLHPRNTLEEVSIYGSARSTPALLPFSEPVSNRSNTTIKVNEESEKALPESKIVAVKLLSDPCGVRPSLPQRAPSRNTSAASPNSPPKRAEAALDKSSSAKTFDSCDSSHITDDESDEFESADEGDEEVWSVAEGFDHASHMVGTIDNNAPTDRTASHPSLESSSRKTTDKKLHQQVSHIATTSKTVKSPLVGAFPRSESFPDSSISPSSSNSRSFEEMPFEQPLQPRIATVPTFPAGKIVYDHRNQTASRSEESPPKSPTRRAAPFDIKRRSQISPTPVEIPHHPTDAALSSPHPSFDHNSRSRTCSLEGLAAHRNPNSPSPQSQKKKSSTRSSAHFRQLTKILNFCVKDGLPDSELCGESCVPIPVDMVEREIRSINPNSSRIGSSLPPEDIELSLPLAGPHLRSSLPPVCPHIPSSSWKNSMPSASYEALRNLYGDLEMQRQEVIWELCETENSFAVGLRQVIEIFASPLRTPEGAWISGVPIDVAKLLDWLEDIVNLHSQIAFQAKNSWQYQTRALGLVVHISEVFLEFAPKLEIYQPYLVRFGETTALIDELFADPDSDFGEFVRMQSALPECGNMSLNSFLLKPIQRLMKYPLFFKQLCEVTPPDHPNHSPTLILLNTTDSMIRVLQEVKEREDEYDKLKALQSKIKSLPPGFTLARRDRRLLAQGLLKRVQVSARDRQDMHSASYNPLASANPALSPVSPMSNHSSELMANSNSRMSSHRSWSQNSLASSFTGSAGSNNSRFSIKTNRENDPISFVKHSYSPSPPIHDSKQFYDWTVVDKSAQRPEDSNHYLRSRASGKWETELESRHRRKNPTTLRLLKKSKESPIHVFVFSDLILLASRHSEGVRLIRTPKIQKKRKDSAYYCALEDVGISRLIAVSDISGEFEYPHLLKLDVLPGGVADQGQQIVQSPVSVLLTFPDRTPGSSQLSCYDDILKERYKWLAAFHQSLRSADSYSKSEHGEEFANGLDPSHPAFQNFPIRVQERQERHWWSARHRLVCRELELLQDDLSPEASDVGNSSLNSRSSDSLRAEPSKISSIVNQHQPVFATHPQNEHARFFHQLKRSGLGLDFGF